MEPLIELCDLIAQKPDQFADKLTWMCGRCIQPESLLAGSPRVSRAQLNAVVALARFLSKCPNHIDQRPEYVVSEFLRSIPLPSTNLSGLSRSGPIQLLRFTPISWVTSRKPLNCRQISPPMLRSSWEIL
ncbi:Phosphatidylinositol 4-kinase alpha 1 [Camellia lanceoleosa]|nr:Phosphatidylinositol 4-kinase alpha 1 [Camellia lanceoleosa]